MGRRLLGFAASFAIHALTIAGALLMTARSVGQTATPARQTRPIEVVVVKPEPGALPGLKPSPDSARNPRPLAPGASTDVALPHFAFDFRKIADRATLLFPFLTPGLSLERFALVPQRNVHIGLDNPLPDLPPTGPIVGGPLEMNELDRQHVIDGAWSRRERWQGFQSIVSLANTYSATRGALPSIVQMYVAQNALQPYIDTTVRDQRLWAQLGVAVDHTDFVSFISQYVSAHPSTRTSTELLFLLDKLIEANLDDLITLLQINPAVDLEWTRRSNPTAYDFVIEIQRFYKSAAADHGLDSPDALRAYYDDLRLTVLNGILRTTPDGYRSADARYLIGSIRWKRHEFDGAINVWSGMIIDPADAYAASASAIQAALPQPNWLAVDQILYNDQARWLSFSYTRLKQFGYQFDTY